MSAPFLRTLSRPALRGVRRFCDKSVPQKTANEEYSGAVSGVGARMAAGGMTTFVYQNIFKSLPMYATTILGLAIVGDLAFDGISDGLWRAANSNKLFDDVIPVRFAGMPPGTEDEEEEDDEDEDEE